MRQIRDLYKWLAADAVLFDLVLGVLCVVLLLGLYALGVALWITLPLPFLTYLGLRWLSTRASLPEAYARCLHVQRQIHHGVKRIEDTQTREAFERSACFGDKCLDAMTEDRKYDIAVPLLSMIDVTNKLLTDYLKVVRRGFDDAEIRERVRGNLESLDVQYDRLWNLLNRETVASLKELSDSIDETKKELEEQPDPPGLPSDLPETVEDAVPPKAAELPVPLTPREVEVLKLMALGLSDRQIGERLFISPRTASDHVSNILRKLDVSTRAEAAAWAARSGIV